MSDACATVMEIIDIPSSPASTSRPTPNQSRHTRPSAFHEEIIEITDSDSEPQLYSKKKRQSTSRRIAEHSFSHQRLPVHLLAEDAVAELSAGSSLPHKDKVTASPLFYPDNDVAEVSPLKQGVSNFPLAPVLPLVPPLHISPTPPEPPTTPPEPPTTPPEPINMYVASVLEIVPDVQPAHVLGLVEQFTHHPLDPGQNILELILHSLLENPNYPKVDRKGKRKRTEDDAEEGSLRGQSFPKIDYGSKVREFKGGLDYYDLALEQLMVDFPYIPKPYLRMRLYGNRFYAPTHMHLAEEQKQDPPRFPLKSIPSKVSGKGRAKHDAEFDAERQWLLQQQDAPISTDADGAQRHPSGQTIDDACGECEDGIECGCCFASYPFDKMVQCPEAHLFCKSCMSSYASNLLGEHNPNIVCMDQSGCKLLFPESELERFLTPKLLELYHRVKQRKEIEAAGLENLEECPFCEYKCVIENEMEKLFRCENADCGAVSCRGCKKPDHLPKSCKEMESDKNLDVQHIVEEAMTRALMRNCPKCQKAFIKEHGCNKMTCPLCHTVSCYVCREVINGYDHFTDSPYGGRVPNTNTNTTKNKKCLLWDPIEQRHANEVQEAAKKAIEELKRDRPDVDASNIKVDLMVVRPAQPVGVGMGMGMGVGMGMGMGVGVGVGVWGAQQGQQAQRLQEAQQVQERLRQRMMEMQRREAELKGREAVWRERMVEEAYRHGMFMVPPPHAFGHPGPGAGPGPGLVPLGQQRGVMADDGMRRAMYMVPPALVHPLPVVPQPVVGRRRSRRN